MTCTNNGAEPSGQHDEIVAWLRQLTADTGTGQSRKQRLQAMRERMDAIEKERPDGDNSTDIRLPVRWKP